MTETTVSPLIDTADMVEVHRVFRNALDAAPRLIGSIRRDHTTQAELAASYYQNVLRLLHAHNDAEDQLLTPKLIERNPGQVAAITYVAAQHKDVLTALQGAETRLDAWGTNPEPAARVKVLDAVRLVKVKVAAHLDLEESTVLPLAARCLDAAEWGELPAHALAAFDGDKPWLVIGLMRAQLSDTHRAHMDAHLPASATMWADGGHDTFEQFIACLGI